MKLENFEIFESVHLKSDGSIYDMHNDYSFKGYRYDVAETRIICDWTLNEGDWIAPGQPASLTLTFDDVVAHWCEPRDPEFPQEEDACVAVIGVGEALDEDDQPVADQDPVFYLQLQSEFSLYIMARNARLSR